MPDHLTESRQTPPTSPSPWAPMLARIESALIAGTVSADDLEKLLAGSQRPQAQRPTASSVLYALGAVVAFAGCALAYATVFSDLSWLARITTPFLFPAVAIVASIVLTRRNLGWQSEVAGLVGYVAFAAACAASIATSGWVDTARQAAWFIVGASAAGVCIGLGLYSATHRARLAWFGVPASLGLGITFLTYALGVPLWAICWVVLAESVLAALVAWWCRSHDPQAFEYAALWALLGSYAAFVAAALAHDFAHFSIWHVILAMAVALAFVIAGALEVDSLMWLATLGGAFWVLTIASIVGSATSGALAVVLAGVALAGLGLLVAKLRSAHHLPFGGP
jgi:hypothetical protein